jgi:transcriptional regulator with XRE-family HTH domain
MHQLADHLGVSIVFISDVERGNRHPFTPDRIIKTAAFLKIKPEPLLLAAAKVRGAFELDATGVSGKARQVGAALMRGWADLDEDDLDKIAQIMRRREGEE